MELHFGMIRDKGGIYSGLAESQSTNRQLAICYNSKDKLLVKICTVASLSKTRDGVRVTLNTQGDDGSPEPVTVMLEQIESIYPINEFNQ
ncbi:MAG TPA: hypothetical protein VF490_11750 [Chryseosolibacter sp.]